MSNDALERLKKRQRPTVPERDSSLSSSLDVSNTRNQDIQKSNTVKTETSAPYKVESLVTPAAQTKNLSVSTNPEDLLKTKQTTLRLEKGLSDRLSLVCKVNNLSREVFLEALFEYYENHQEIEAEIITQAQTKADYRMQIANCKRARSMMERFNS